ncbi:MAG: TIGR02996 domain-containing protein [Gemmataceae bacterium]|nr:TIGR02996 domain-containing protein [Gemmataceae bacterium]
MTDRDALLAAILAQPEEDTPRLMFADWLQENGEVDRGQFVRLQVEAGQAEGFSPQARALDAQARALLERHRAAWAPDLPDGVMTWQFARGFIEHATANVAVFARDAAALFAAHPVRELGLTRFVVAREPVPLSSVFRVPQLARVRRLDVPSLAPTPDDFAALANCPHLTGLTDLNLANNPVPPEWLRALISGSTFPGLVGLNLAENVHLSRVLSEALPAAVHRKFVRLDLSHIMFLSDQIQKALASKCVRDVQELRAGWRESAGPGPLTHLNLGWTIPLDRLRLQAPNTETIWAPQARSKGPHSG